MANFKWVVEFEVDETWVADGFDLTDERAHEMLNNDLRYAHGSELKAKVIQSPSARSIAKAQGYVNPGSAPFYGIDYGIAQVEKTRREGVR